VLTLLEFEGLDSDYTEAVMSLSRFGVFTLLAALLSAQPSFDAASRTRELLDQVLAGKCEPFYELWMPGMQKALPLEVYRAQLSNYGLPSKPESVGLAAVEEIQGQKIVTIPFHWQAVTLNFSVTWTPEARISGTWLNAQAAAKPWARPAYSKPDSFRERAVTVGAGEWKLPGMLSVPVGKGPFAAVALVHGSGPQDLDETAGGAKVFKDLAEGLASCGTVVLRYDKRTKVHGAKMATMKDLTIQHETIDDAVLAADLLRSLPEIDPKRVFVLGHSLGAYAAPRIAKQDSKLAGVILLAGSTRPLEVLVKEQLEYLGARGRDGEILKNLPAAYMADLHAYDPATTARSLTLPMLILQGERDYQVTMKDFAGWKTALDSRRNVTMKSYPALNHLFIAGEGKSLPAEYQKPGHVSPEVIDDIAKWINSATSRPSPAPSARNRYCAPCARAAGI
jgi:dienelactone hydrolase